MKILVEEKTPFCNPYTISCHSHHFWQLDYYPGITTGWNYFMGKKIPIKSDEVYLIPPEQKHKIEVKKSQLDYSIKFDADDNDFKCLRTCIIPWSEHEDVFSKLFFNIPSETKINMKIKSNYLSILLLRLLQKENLFSEYGNVKDSRIRAVLYFIMASLHKHLCTETLAEKAGVSKYHFIKIFRKETGVTPGQYIQDIKIEKAFSLLNFSDLNINQIAEVLAYPDIQTFSRAFKNKTGTAPLNYRKNLKKAAYSKNSTKAPANTGSEQV
jgi:AraC-like DNA-binding protein